METRTVLVIEDNELNIKLLRTLLQMQKYRVLEAVDAETGLQLVGDHKPDLILMDIQLPGLDGLSATRLIKRDSALKHIQVLALTSYAMQGDEEKALAAGCAGHIAKPIDTRRFLETVSHFLNQKRDS